MVKASGAMPLAVNCCQLSQAARGTPTKLTRSLPAKAKARAKVPARMTILKMLTPRRTMSRCSTTLRPANSTSRMGRVWALIQARYSGFMKDAPLAPFMIRK